VTQKDDMDLSNRLERPPLHRGLSFAYRIYEPSERATHVLVLLHGSGVDETVLVPLAQASAPDARLVAVRGRIVQDGSRRWFTRITPTEFDQRSIREEADAFASFLPEVARREAFDLNEAVTLGYSNGANLASSVMLFHPSLIRFAVLLRAMPVLKDEPTPDLHGVHVLVISGERDTTYGPYAPALRLSLERCRAVVESHTAQSGHEFSNYDVNLIRAWLRKSAIAHSA